MTFDFCRKNRLQKLDAQYAMRKSVSMEATVQIHRRYTVAHVKLDLKAICVRSILMSALGMNARMELHVLMALMSTLVTVHQDLQGNCKFTVLDIICNSFLLE